MSENRTSLIIAHRLSTIKDVDRIVFVKDGQILEEGSHEVLMQHDGPYKQLYLSLIVDKRCAMMSDVRFSDNFLKAA